MVPALAATSTSTSPATAHVAAHATTPKGSPSFSFMVRAMDAALQPANPTPSTENITVKPAPIAARNPSTKHPVDQEQTAASTEPQPASTTPLTTPSTSEDTQITEPQANTTPAQPQPQQNPIAVPQVVAVAMTLPASPPTKPSNTPTTSSTASEKKDAKTNTSPSTQQVAPASISIGQAIPGVIITTINPVDPAAKDSPKKAPEDRAISANTPAAASSANTTQTKTTPMHSSSAAKTDNAEESPTTPSASAANPSSTSPITAPNASTSQANPAPASFSLAIPATSTTPHPSLTPKITTASTPNATPTSASAQQGITTTDLHITSYQTTTANRLEVGIRGGSLGWLNIRAELTTDGGVHTTLRGSQEATAQLRTQAGDIASFLADNAVSIRQVAIETLRTPATSQLAINQADTDASLSGNAEGQRNPTQQQSSSPQQRPSTNHDATQEDMETLSLPLISPLHSGPALATTGGWLSVRV